MKKIFLVFSLFLALIFSGCENKSSSAESSDGNLVVLKVGASPTPHAKILENIKDDLKKEGVDLQIIEFSDYVLPNIELNDGTLQANFFQHQPYLDKMVEDKKLKIESIAKIHIEPLGLYSNKIKNIKDLKNGAVIAVPNDPSNEGRALILLNDNGLIKLKDPKNLYSSELDIIKNPKNLKIKPLEAAMIPRTINDVDAAVINGNYALQAGFTTKDALLLESKDSPYANVLVVRDSDVSNPAILKLKAALTSPKTKEFIEKTFKGEIVPAF